MASNSASNGQPEEWSVRLQALCKDCETLWEENKDSQGQFVNDVNELHRCQGLMQQIESHLRNGVVKQSESLQEARQTIQTLQQRASQVYQSLVNQRQSLVLKLNEGVQQVAVVQNSLIGTRLLEWKQQQKLAQIGAPFDRRDELLDQIQNSFEELAEFNWQLRTYANWMVDLLRRGPQLPDNNARDCSTHLSPIIDNLTKLLWVLVSQSFIVSQLPEPLLKTQHKFAAEVRLLIGDKLGIKQQLDNVNVTVKIISEEQARQLHANEIREKDIKEGVGSICNDFEKIKLDKSGKMSAKFSNTKLTRIAPRKPVLKGGAAAAEKLSAPAATDQKYGLVFHISPFQLGNLGKFDLWTLSLPVMVTVHGSQDCDALATILWHRAFGSVSWSTTAADVAWPVLAEALSHIFLKFAGVKRQLSEADLAYLAEKLCSGGDGSESGSQIGLNRFAKQPLRDDVAFSFWEWFFSIMQLIRQKLQVYWDEGWLVGFVSKQDASLALGACAEPSFLLRFSDTQLGAVSIGFVCADHDNRRVPFHLSPFGVKDLDQLSLAQRIASCPQLRDIRWLYPSCSKEAVLRRFESDERAKSPTPPTAGGYVGSQVIMVAKTAGLSAGSTETFSPSSMLSQQLNLESPGGSPVLFAQSDAPSSSSMETNEEGAQMAGLNDSHDNLEQLLGADFLNMFQQHPVFPQLDLTDLMDNFAHNFDPMADESMTDAQ